MASLLGNEHDGKGNGGSRTQILHQLRPGGRPDHLVRRVGNDHVRGPTQGPTPGPADPPPRCHHPERTAGPGRRVPCLPLLQPRTRPVHLARRVQNDHVRRPTPAPLSNPGEPRFGELAFETQAGSSKPEGPAAGTFRFEIQKSELIQITSTSQLRHRLPVQLIQAPGRSSAGVPRPESGGAA